MEISRLSKTGQHSGTMSSSIDSTSKNYSLNITRALQKKLEATKRNQQVEYKYTSGGMIVTAYTATFELIRIASIHYFESTHWNKDEIHIRKYTDNSNSTVVQYTIKITQPESGYTVNIYTTTSRLLINGKGWQKFIDKDIPLIHGIISNCNTGISLDELNHQLADQLEDLLNRGQNSSQTEFRNPTSPETQNISCLKCNKKCRTRSTYCTTGKHWIHYRCQNLTETEIEKIEKTKPEEEYTCKVCYDPTNNRLAITQNEECCEETQAKQLMDEEISIRSTDETQVKQIMEEVVTGNIGENPYTSIPTLTCIICDSAINNPNCEVSSICNNICHNQCLVEINGVYTCLSCNIRELDETQQNEINESHENSIVNAELPTNTSVNRTIPKQRKNMKNKPVPRPRKSANKEQKQPDNLKEVKLRELRAREAKLRKAEEQLKIKEKSIDELKNEKIMLETRCQHLRG